MSNSIRYSLLVPAYNAEKYIDGFLTNIAALTIPFDEVLFYDDASTDGTYETLKTKGLNVIQGSTNKGPGYARNKLAAAAEGEYIHFHDIDDEFAPGFLALINKKLAAAVTDVVVGSADWIDPASRQPIIRYRYNQAELSINPLNYFIAHPLGIINTLYKKDIFLKVGGFNEELKCWEDSDLHVRLAAAGAAFGIIDEVIAYSIRHNEGLSKDQAKCWHCRLEFVSKYLADYKNIVPREILGNEVKKIQNALIGMGAFEQLKQVMHIDAEYQLNVTSKKIKLIYNLSKFMPASLLNKFLGLMRSL